MKTLNSVSDILSKKGYEIQTKRICSPVKIKNLEEGIGDESILLSAGTLSKEKARNQLDNFLNSGRNISFNLDLSKESISEKEVDFLFKIIRNKPEKTFNFTFVFNNPDSSPFFPSSSYKKEGFSLGLQPTNLSAGCSSIKEWLEKTRKSWQEINNLFSGRDDYLGIDSSIAPLFEKEGSFINFINRLGWEFKDSVTTDIYTRISKFIKEENPRPAGLCGLMFPCLEDFDLAREYERGEFSIERNIFLSLHSGLGIDTYPIAVDQNKKRVREILNLTQALSNKHKKPLSTRFVSDGKAKIGEKTNFQNQYLKNVVLKGL